MNQEDQENQLMFLTKCRSSFKFFAENAIPEKIKIEPFHQEWVELVEQNQNVCITAFTGSGKTTILGIIYPLWKALFTPKWEALIISSSMNQSKSVLQRIKDYISDSEILRVLKSEDREKTWSSSQVNLTNGVKIYVRPYNAEKHTVKGIHVDYIALDEAGECQPLEIFDRFVMTRAQRKNGKVVAFSTPVSEVDLIQKISEREEFISKVYPAVTSEGKAIYPEVFDENKLELIKKRIGTSAYEREYLCKSIASEESLFSPNDVLNCFNKTLSLNSGREKDERYFLGVDFAASKKGDYSVFTTLAQKPDGTIILKQVDRTRGMSIVEQEQNIEQLHSIFNYEMITIDETQFGQSILQNLRNKYLPMRGQNFESRNRIDLLMNLKRLVESGRFIIPYDPNSERTQMLMDQLYKELTAFGKGKTITGRETYVSSAAHDDMVVSLAMAAKETITQREVSDDIAF